MGNASDPDAFVEVAAPALRAAASIARALEGRVANRPKAGEASPVKAALTVADTACQEAILAPLHARFPDLRVAAEEDTPTARRFAGSGDGLVVVDPIDGTLRFYLEALGPYAILVGLAVAGEYRAGLVALPREELLLQAVRGSGAWTGAGGSDLRPAVAGAGGNRVLISHDLPAASVEVLLSRGFSVAPASGGAISVAPLLPGVRAGLRLARGPAARVSIRGRIGALVSAEAGLRVADETGARFPSALEEPVRALLVARDEPDLDALRAALEAAGAD